MFTQKKASWYLKIIFLINIANIFNIHPPIVIINIIVVVVFISIVAPPMVHLPRSVVMPFSGFLLIRLDWSEDGIVLIFLSLFSN